MIISTLDQGSTHQNRGAWIPALDCILDNFMQEASAWSLPVVLKVMDIKNDRRSTRSVESG